MSEFIGQITIEQQLEEAKRELRMREYVYPNRVNTGKMKQSEMDKLITIQKAIISTLTEVAKRDAPQQSMF